MAVDLGQIIPPLVRAKVARVTFDVDFVYSRTRENIERIAVALAPHSPHLRDAPPGLPFAWDVRTISSGLNFTLTTKLGDVDLFGEVAGGDTYQDLLAHCLCVPNRHFACPEWGSRLKTCWAHRLQVYVPCTGFLSDVSLFTSALVPFSKSIPHALSRARVAIQINKNIQIGTSRIRNPSQITYGW